MVKNTPDAAGLVLMLDKDHYLASGFYHVFKKMGELQQQERPECDVLSLGTQAAARSFSGTADKLKTLGRPLSIVWGWP